MSRAGRELQVGDYGLTDFNGKGRIVRVRILERIEGQQCQSGILFKVKPILANGDEDSRYDADWFWPEPSTT